MVKGTRATAGAGSRGGSTKKPKTKPDAPGAVEAPGPSLGDNSGDRTKASRLTDSEERELFASHRTIWNGLTAKQKLLDEQWARAKGSLKGDGFKVLHMQIADQLITPKGEKKVHADVKDRLWVARMIGHALGKQMDLFEAPDRTPAVDRAYDDGRTASIDNQPRKPPHDPSTEQYREWMRGYNDHQEELCNRVGRGGGELPATDDTVANAAFAGKSFGDAEQAGDGERTPSDYVVVDSNTANVVSRDEFRERLQGQAREVDAGIKGAKK